MAVRFDAAADRLLRTANNPSVTANFSMSFHVYLVSDLNTWSTFWYMGTNIYSNYIFVGTDNDGATLLVDIGGTTGTGPVLSTATWYYITIDCNWSSSPFQTSVRVWNISGVQVGSTVNVANRPVANDRFEFGAATSSNTDRADIRIFNIKRWDSIRLPIAELQSEQWTLLPRAVSTFPTAWWPCLPGSPERLRDYSPRGYDFTAGGTLTDEQSPPIVRDKRARGGVYVVSTGASPITGRDAGLAWDYGAILADGALSFRAWGKSAEFAGIRGLFPTFGQDAGVGVEVGTPLGRGVPVGRLFGSAFLYGGLDGTGVLSGRDDGSSVEFGGPSAEGSLSGLDTLGIGDYAALLGLFSISGRDFGESSEIGPLAGLGGLRGRDSSSMGEMGGISAEGALSSRTDGFAQLYGYLVDAGSLVIGPLFVRDYGYAWLAAPPEASGNLSGRDSGNSFQRGLVQSFLPAFGVTFGAADLFGRIAGEGNLAARDYGLSHLVGTAQVFARLYGRTAAVSWLAGRLEAEGQLFGIDAGNGYEYGLLSIFGLQFPLPVGESRILRPVGTSKIATLAGRSRIYRLIAESLIQRPIGESSIPTLSGMTKRKS